MVQGAGGWKKVQSAGSWKKCEVREVEKNSGKKVQVCGNRMRESSKVQGEGVEKKLWGATRWDLRVIARCRMLKSCN